MTPELLRNALSNMALNIEKAGPRNAMDTTAETLREAADYIAKAAVARLQAFEEAAKIADARAVLYQGKIEKRGHGLGDISREDLVIASEAIASAIRRHAKGGKNDSAAT